MSEKKFPILGTNESIDWNLIAPHEKQAMENHGQTLEKLARRHGLSWYELLCVMADKKLLVDIKYDKEKDYEKLCRQVLLLEEVKQYRAIGTPEECRAAVEKQTAISRELIEGKYFCPKCHNLMPYPGYCGCGQKVY
nr:MAG TPA: DNA REPAIR HELICASE RAD25, SSL2, PRE-INITIATION COMPLEX, RNA POLYMERASE.0A [Caudoviricetes sp.]